MTLGEKLKRIRTFRGMTQKDLGVAVGFDDKGADNRIAQYETNYRVPKEDLLKKMAKVLRVSPYNFYDPDPGCAEEILRTLFWLDDVTPGLICLFQMVPDEKRRKSEDSNVYYRDDIDLPVKPPVGMYFDYSFLNDSIAEWLIRQQELKANEITKDEYFEWKLNWPYTCDGSKVSKTYIPWRKEK